jgi:hypothetical protein
MDYMEHGFRWELTTPVGETLARIMRASHETGLVVTEAHGRFRVAQAPDVMVGPRDGVEPPRVIVSDARPTLVIGTLQPRADGSLIEVRAPSRLHDGAPAALLLLWPLVMLVIAIGSASALLVGPLFVIPIALGGGLKLWRRRRELQAQTLQSLGEALADVRLTAALGPYR